MRKKSAPIFLGGVMVIFVFFIAWYWTSHRFVIEDFGTCRRWSDDRCLEKSDDLAENDIIFMKVSGLTCRENSTRVLGDFILKNSADDVISSWQISRTTDCDTDILPLTFLFDAEQRLKVREEKVTVELRVEDLQRSQVISRAFRMGVF